MSFTRSNPPVLFEVRRQEASGAVSRLRKTMDKHDCGISALRGPLQGLWGGAGFPTNGSVRRVQPRSVHHPFIMT